MNEYTKQNENEKKDKGFGIHGASSYDKLLGQGQSCQNCDEDDGSHRLPGSFDTSNKGQEKFSTTMPVNQILTPQSAGPESTSGKYNMETSEKTDIKGGKNASAKSSGNYNMETREKTDIKGGNNAAAKNSGKYNMETREKTDIKGGNSASAKNLGHDTNNRHDSGRMAQSHFSPNFDANEVFGSNVGSDHMSPKSQSKGFDHSTTPISSSWKKDAYNKQNLGEDDDDEDGIDPRNVPRPAHLNDEPSLGGSDMPNYNRKDFNDSMKGMQHNENVSAKLPDPPKTTVPGYGLKKDTISHSKDNHQDASVTMNATDTSKTDFTPQTTVPGYGLKRDTVNYSNNDHQVDPASMNETDTSKPNFTPQTTIPGYGLKKDTNYSKSDAPMKTSELNDPKPKTSESQSRAAKSNGKGAHRRDEKGPNLKHMAAPYMPQDTTVPRFGFEGIAFRKKSVSGPASPTNEKSFFARRMSFGKSDTKQDTGTVESAAGTTGMDASERTRMGSASSGTGSGSRRSSTGSAGRKSKNKLHPSRRAAVDDQPTGLSPDQLEMSGRKLDRSLSIGSEDAGVYAKTVGNMPSLIDPSVPTYGHKVINETTEYDNDNGGGYKMHSKDTAAGRKVSVGSHGSPNHEQAMQESPQLQETHEREVAYSYDPTTVPRSHIEHDGKDTSHTDKKVGVFEKIRRTLSNHTES